MPTYSYRCTECHEAFDIQQAFTDDSLTVCPNCGGKLRKLFSAVGVSFTGSGFYRNDSRAPAPSEGGSSSAAAAKSEGSSGSGSGSEGGSPSTPAKSGSGAAASSGASPSGARSSGTRSSGTPSSSKAAPATTSSKG